MTAQEVAARREQRAERIRLEIEQRGQDACEHVNAHMREAIEWIDAQFGDGYAKKHPVLLAGFLQASVRREIYNEEWEDRQPRVVW